MPRVLAVPSSSSGDGARANLIWTTTRAPASGTLAQWAAKRWLSTKGSTRRALPRLAPRGVARAETYAIGPVTHRGRSLHSVQTVFVEGGRLHHLTLLMPNSRDAAELVGALRDLLRTFRRGSTKHPCDS